MKVWTRWKDTAAEHGVSKNTFFRRIYNGVPPKQAATEPVHRTTDEQLAEMRRLYTEEGKTQRQIAEIMGFTQAVISRHTKGLYRKRKLTPQMKREMRIQFYSDSSISVKDLAKMHGVSETTIYRYLNEDVKKIDVT